MVAGAHLRAAVRALHHEAVLEEVAYLAHSQCGALERDVIAVHEQNHFLAACDGETHRDLFLQTLFRLHVRRDDRRYAPHSVTCLRERIRNRRKAAELRRLAERHTVAE